jgi:site-specific recombinase XerD
MGQLRKRMEEDLVLHGLRKGTREVYLHCAKQFAAFHGKSPTELGGEDIREYLLHLVDERQLRASSIGVHIGALKFLYSVTLGRPEEVASVAYPKRRQRLPEPLTAAEIGQLLSGVYRIKHRAAILLAYSAGLRCGEVCRLQVSDIDSEQMRIRVRDGKRGKDRYTLLGARVLEVLRDYYRSQRPTPPFLFPSRLPGRPMAPNVLARVIRRAARRAGLAKRVSPHVLRHSFATQLLDDGCDLLTLQHLLGHSSLRSTMRYVHTSTARLHKVLNPAEHITVFGPPTP